MPVRDLRYTLCQGATASSCRATAPEPVAKAALLAGASAAHLQPSTQRNSSSWTSAGARRAAALRAGNGQGTMQQFAGRPASLVRANVASVLSRSRRGARQCRTGDRRSVRRVRRVCAACAPRACRPDARPGASDAFKCAFRGSYSSLSCSLSSSLLENERSLSCSVFRKSSLLFSKRSFSKNELDSELGGYC